MGIPSFFRWNQDKYPKIVVDAIEEKKAELNGVEVPVDATKPNPNFQEFDNLYLDMNGIIHPCTHSDNRPKTEEEMFRDICEYIDKVFALVRPRRVLFMAIDGVAPRAKLNQQRSRRFRSAKEAAEREVEINRMREKLEAEGVPLPPPKKAEEKFDSNCITPGTPFMERLAAALRYYVHQKQSNDPAWANIEVRLSDSSVPGEGEHKIMEFIRCQRASPSHDPNTAHCLCGLDADLIMLGLATHEANFTILREEFVPNKPRPCELCYQFGHGLKNCTGLPKDDKAADSSDKAAESNDKVVVVRPKPLECETKFKFVRIPVLREYLEKDLKDGMEDLPFKFDLERAIDDWVSMCVFVGNDFLPHLPSLEIRENAIERLMNIYKQMVRETKGWLTNAGEVSLDRVQFMMKALGEKEDQIFIDRKDEEISRKREHERKRREEEALKRTASAVASLDNSSENIPPQEMKKDQKGGEKESVAECKDAEMKFQSPTKSHPVQSEVQTSPSGTKRSAPEGSENDSAINPPSAKDCTFSDDRAGISFFNWLYGSLRHLFSMFNFQQPKLEEAVLPASDGAANEEKEEKIGGIAFHKPGYKSRYYLAKFAKEESDIEFRQKVARDYAEGLCWVLKYYYQGCPSWEWYYPHRYAPFASDFDAISDFIPDFSKPTKPFKPMEQLMAVFPAASKSLIPEAWRGLMTNADSPLSEFYPTDFKIDLNGQKYAWQGVVLLPFVDQEKLLKELEKVYPQLTEDEKRRNTPGVDRIFVKNSHPLFFALKDVYEDGKKCNFETKKDEEGNAVREWIPFDPKLAYGMAGEIVWDKDAVEDGVVYPSMFRNSSQFKDIDPNMCMMASFRDPFFPPGYNFSAIRLPNVVELESVLKSKENEAFEKKNFVPSVVSS